MSLATNPLGQTTNYGSSVIIMPVAVAAGTTVTLTPAQSGSTIVVPPQPTGVLTINLPTLLNQAAGCTWKFLCNATPATNTVVINTVAAALVGQVNAAAITNYIVPATQANGRINLVAAAGGIGIQVDVTCDGVLYYFKAVCGTNGAVTAT